jgi:lipid-binding SYLF domain-containing protein
MTFPRTCSIKLTGSLFTLCAGAAFIVGGSYGRGAITCRKGEDVRGPWGPPTMMAFEGGSFVFQLGGQATDFVLLVMNDSDARGILAGKVKCLRSGWEGMLP